MGHDHSHGGGVNAPEFESVEVFAEFLMDDERTSFTLAEAAQVAQHVRCTNREAIDALCSYGFEYTPPAFGRRVRGFSANDNDRWYGPGACKTHGGSGWEQISGFAGQKG